MVFLIILYEIYCFYSYKKTKVEIENNHCLRDYHANKCDEHVFNYYEDNEKRVKKSEFMSNFCKEKLKCVASNQVIFTDYSKIDNSESVSDNLNMDDYKFEESIKNDGNDDENTSSTRESVSNLKIINGILIKVILGLVIIYVVKKAFF